MRQGEIWRADLNPVRGSEQAGFRPVVIVSGNLMNEHMGIVIVMPLTSKVRNWKGNVVLEANGVNGLSSPSEVLTMHIRSIAKGRLVEKLGSITEAQLNDLKVGLSDLMRY
jgi:mRNA interferase MazF